MEKVYGKLTVYFEEPFLVGVFERIEDGTLSVAKVTFGAEPKDYEVQQYTLFRETYHSVTSRFFSNNTCWKLIFAIHFISPTRLNKILFFYCIIMHYPV